MVTQNSRTNSKRNNEKQKLTNVFVVHGRNDQMRNSIFSFLRSIGLHPLEWSQIVKATGKSSPYIGEVLDMGFSMSQAVVVLMTPDDEARLKQEFRKNNDPDFESKLTAQPRPNVLIESGMAMGMFPQRTIIVEFGLLRPISDFGGRNVVRLNNSPEQRHELAQRLQTAGCKVDISGKDWYKVGNFVLEQIETTSDIVMGSVVASVEKIATRTTRNVSKQMESQSNVVDDSISFEEKKLVEEIDRMSIHNLVIIALRIKPEQTKSEIEKQLQRWGKNSNNWFRGGNFNKSLVNTAIVISHGKSDAGELFILSKKGEQIADKIISAINKK